MQIERSIFLAWSDAPVYEYCNKLDHLLFEREWRSPDYPGIFYKPHLEEDDIVSFENQEHEEELKIGKFVALTANYADGNSGQFEEDYNKGNLKRKVKLVFRVNENQCVTFESLLD
jgi:hypothetical protein